MKQIEFGDALTCAETGKQFTAAQDGCSTNYARDIKGNIYSDEGVDICEQRGLLDRSQPFTGYISMDGVYITGWKGNVLGQVISRKETKYRSNWGKVEAFKVRDIHGGRWHGRAVAGCCINLYPTKKF